MRSFLTILSLLALATLPAAAQEAKKGVLKLPELNRKEPIAYEKEIEPIFFKYCIACHSGTVKEAKFDIASYEGLIKGGKRGAPLVPGKGSASNIIKMLCREMKPSMPPKGEEPITPEEVALIKLWIDQGAKAPTGQRVRPPVILSSLPTSVHPVRAVALSPDKTMVAAGRGNQIHIFDANTGNFVRSLTAPGLKLADGKEVKAAHPSIVESLAYSPDGKFLVSGSFQEVGIWDAKTGELKQKLTGFAHNVVAVAFSHDGKLLAACGGAPTEDGEIKLFEVGSFNKVADFKNAHSDTVYGACFSPDGKMIATCSADKFVKVFEVPSGKFVRSFEGHTHQVLDVGWQSNGKILASAGADNTVKVWDFEKGEQIRTIAAHGKQVTRLLFVGNTPQIVTCSGDQQVKFFNVEGGNNTRNFGGNNDFVYAVTVSTDGAVVAAGGEEGIVRIYNGNNGQIVRSLQPPDAQPAEAPKK